MKKEQEPLSKIISLRRMRRSSYRPGPEGLSKKDSGHSPEPVYSLSAIKVRRALEECHEYFISLPFQRKPQQGMIYGIAFYDS